MLTQAQADLGFGLQVSELFSRQRDAHDTQSDLADISAKQDQIMAQMEGAQKQAEDAASKEHKYMQARFASMADKQQQMIKWVARLSREQKQAEQRSQDPDAVIVAGSAPVSPSSPSSPRPMSSDLLHIDLFDLQLDAGHTCAAAAMGTSP